MISNGKHNEIKRHGYSTQSNEVKMLCNEKCS